MASGTRNRAGESVPTRSGDIGSTAVVLLPADASGRQSLTIKNNGAIPLFVGSFAAVTAITGLQIDAGGSLTIRGSGKGIWGIRTAADSGATVTTVLQ